MGTTRASDELPDTDDLNLLDRYWRAANYLSVGQIYLLDNPLLKEPLRPEHIKPRLLGHWGTTPGLNFIYAHLNRAIRALDLNVIYVCGPGHGGPGMVANTYLEGTYSEIYPDISRDTDGLRQSIPAVLLPGRHPQPRRPGDAGVDPRGRRTRLRAGARLWRSFRQSRSDRRLRRRRRRSRDRAARRLLAFQQVPEPVHDGAVLPILHLNGYKIANPTVLGRMGDDEIRSSLLGYGYEPLFVEGDEPAAMHRLMAAALEHGIRRASARSSGPRATGATRASARNGR